MFIGHLAIGLAAKKAAPKASLGTLFLAVQFLDLLWPIFLLLGWEHVRISPGNTSVTPLDFYDYPFSHGLASALVWSALLGIAYYFINRNARRGWVVFFCVISHWVLDAVVHRPDLPLAPGFDSMIGFGLWNAFTASVVFEGALFLAGVAIYMRTTRALDATGRWAFWSLVFFMLLLWTANLVAPPPPNWQAVAYAGLALWLIVPWGFWIDRHRRNIMR